MNTDGIEWMQFPAIDIHGHTGVWAGIEDPLTAQCQGAPPDAVSRRADACRIALTVVSELAAFDTAPDRPADVAAGNAQAVAAAEQFDNLRFWAVVNPKRPGWQSPTDKLLDHPRCAGVKLHPRFHWWPVEQCAEQVFAYLNERSVLTLTHTGHAGNEPERFIPYANRFPNARLILAHLGNDDVDDTLDRQIKAVQAATQGNVWTDTSSFRSVTSNLVEYAVQTLGDDRILFGTDTPIYWAAMQKSRVAYAEISADAKRNILHDNAAGLLDVTVSKK